MHESLATLFAGSAWETAPEVSFSIYGERGVIDVLAFHHPTRSLLVVELKTDLVDVQELIGAVDRYRRLAAQIAADRGWLAATTSAWVAVRDTRTNRRRVAAHARVLRSAFPTDGRRLRPWLRAPSGAVACLSFLPDSSGMSVSASSSGVQRVRLPHSSVGRVARSGQGGRTVTR
jgi:hypothetical protein